MGALFVLVPISFALAIVGVAAFVWAMKSGQYDDTQSPAERLVLEDSDVENI